MAADYRTLRRHLLDIFCGQFDLEEVRTLCFLLEINYDSLRGEGLAAKARELIRHTQNRGLLSALVEEGRFLRPDIDWPDVSVVTPDDVSSSDGVRAAVHAPRVVHAAPVAHADDLEGCVFVSYSRADQSYARRLADELHARGFKPWMDDRIDFGGRWWQTIVRAVRASTAVVVVMTPEAERSRWVEREVLLAEREGKPIVPLLLRGREFPLLINVQYVDVTGDRMPPPFFYDRLGRALGRPSAPQAGAPKVPAQDVAIERAGRRERVPETPESPSLASEKPTLPAVLVPRQPYEPEMVLIPAGEFLMGSDLAKDKDGRPHERPQHTLTLPDYYLARTPVTNAQYLAFVQATDQDAPKTWEGDRPPPGKADHPVVDVTWHDAIAYCRWLAQSTGKLYTLPSEAEWEKGARGTDGLIYPWGNRWDTARCNSAEDGKGNTTPVGAYPGGASPYGLMDMAGNVWEWTRTLWGKAYPYDLNDDREELAAGDARVVRGGAFAITTWLVRCASRYRGYPVNWYRYDGFRVVLGPG